MSNVLLWIYEIIGHNFGIAIILFTILIRAITWPLTAQQLKGTQGMQELQMQPKLKELQKKYKNDKEKLSQEQIKLYKKVGYNPLGCFGSMVPQFIVLIAIIQVIKVVTNNNLTGLYPFVQNWVFGTTSPEIFTHFLNIDLGLSYSTVAKEIGHITLQSIPYIVLALAVGITQYFTTALMQKMKRPQAIKKEKPRKKGEIMSPEEMQEKMTQSTNLILPFLTIITTLSLPSVLGLYWFIQSLMLIFQYWLLDRDQFTKAFKNWRRK